MSFEKVRARLHDHCEELPIFGFPCEKPTCGQLKAQSVQVSKGFEGSVIPATESRVSNYVWPLGYTSRPTAQNVGLFKFLALYFGYFVELSTLQTFSLLVLSRSSALILLGEYSIAYKLSHSPTLLALDYKKSLTTAGEIYWTTDYSIQVLIRSWMLFFIK